MTRKRARMEWHSLLRIVHKMYRGRTT